MVCAASNLFSISARGPTATIESPRMAMAPSSVTRRCPSMVTTVPPVTSKSTLSFANVVGGNEKITQQQVHADNSEFCQLLRNENMLGFCIFPLEGFSNIQDSGGDFLAHGGLCSTETTSQTDAVINSRRSRARSFLSDSPE